MPKAPVKQFTSWSFSRYSDYKRCPLSAKLKHLDKISEPPNKAMARGAEIHVLAENYIKGKSRTMPKELKLFEIEFKELRKLYKKDQDKIVVEDNWAFKSDWARTLWNDWAECWTRIKLDCAHQEDPGVLIVTDWKTGKFRHEMSSDYIEQLELYALGAMLMFPEIKEVRPRLGYLDHGVIYPEEDEPLVYTRKDVPKLKKLWEKRVSVMMKDKVFPAKPNDKCKYCFYRKSNTAGGGQCKY